MDGWVHHPIFVWRTEGHGVTKRPKVNHLDEGFYYINTVASPVFIAPPSLHTDRQLNSQSADRERDRKEGGNHVPRWYVIAWVCLSKWISKFNTVERGRDQEVDTSGNRGLSGRTCFHLLFGLCWLSGLETALYRHSFTYFIFYFFVQLLVKLLEFDFYWKNKQSWISSRAPGVGSQFTLPRRLTAWIR